MESIRELMRLKKSPQEMAEIAKNRFLEKGYVFNEVCGWVNPKDLEQFCLDPNMEAIPAQLYNDVDYKEVINEEKDAYGRKTGNKKVEKVPFETGKKVWCANWKWFEYAKWKENKEKSQYANFKEGQRLESSESY